MKAGLRRSPPVVTAGSDRGAVILLPRNKNMFQPLVLRYGTTFTHNVHGGSLKFLVSRRISQHLPQICLFSPVPGLPLRGQGGTRHRPGRPSPKETGRAFAKYTCDSPLLRGTVQNLVLLTK